MGRFILLCLLVFCGLGGLFAGKLGALIGLGLASAIFIALAATAEKTVRAPHLLEDRQLASLKATYRRVLERRGVKITHAPQIQIYSYPVPNLFFARGIFSRGVLAVSQGAISFCSEGELRALLEEGLDEIESPKTIWSTIHAAFRSRVFQFLPEGTVEFLAGASFKGFQFGEGLCFALLLPWVRRRPMIRQTNEALNRFERLNHLWPSVPCPSAAALYLFDPESKRMILGAKESHTLV